MNVIKNFFAEHNLSSATLVGLYGTFTAFLAADQAARDTVFAFLNKHPVYALLFSFAAFAYAKYSGSHSTQGVVKLVANTPPKQIATAITAVKAASAPEVPVVPDLQNVVAAAAAKPPTPPAPPA